MKISPCAIRVIGGLLAVGTTTAFVPNTIGSLSQNLPVSAAGTTTTSRFASEVNTEESTKFPFTDRQVRYAYDEWRLIYGKGDFNPERFKSFKSNHRTLVISNLKAREKAAQDGRPMPQWMSLNEYGDYSMEEYEAMLRGEDPRKGESMQYSVTGSSDSLVADEQQVRSTQLVQNDDLSMNYNNNQVSEYQDAFGRTIRSTQAVNQELSLESAAMEIDDNYANNIDDNQGTVIIPKDESGTQVIGERGTQVVGTNSGTQVVGTGAQRGTQVIGSGAQRGTQVVGSGAVAQRGTQVIATGSGAQRGTQVVASAGSQIRGTQVVGKNGSRGTQVLSTNGVAYGTQPINGNGGTQVVKPADNLYNTQNSDDDEDDEFDYQSNAGTQIIPKNQPGTQIIPKEQGGTKLVSNVDGEGTQVVTEGTPAGTQVVNTQGGTQVLEKSGDDVLSKIFGTIFGESEKIEDTDEKDTDEIAKRGTMVIKRSFKAPEQKKKRSIFEILFSDVEKKEEKETEASAEISMEKPTGEESKDNDFFGFLSSKEEETTAETVTKATEAEEAGQAGGGIFSLFGGNVQSSNPRPVRTSISLQKQKAKKSTITVSRKQKAKKSTITASQRKTKLIPDKAEEETGVPSILSFFGGAKKVDEEDTVRNPKSRPTLILKKPKTNQFSSLFAGKKSEESPAASTANKNPVIAEQIAKRKQAIEKAAAEAKAKAQQRLQKPAATTPKRGVSAAKKPVTTEPKPLTSPFNFFGAMGKKSTAPTLKNWRQNRDGTISGRIYDSKSFADGTRITTSPIPRGAKKGTIVKTGGGSEYSLE